MVGGSHVRFDRALAQNVGLVAYRFDGRRFLASDKLVDLIADLSRQFAEKAERWDGHRDVGRKGSVLAMLC